MLLRDVEVPRRRDVPGLVQREHLGARGGEVVVRAAHLREEGRLARIVLCHLVEQVHERRFRIGDLLVVAVLLRQQRHGTVVALGGDEVEHLLRALRLVLQTIELADPVVHALDDHEAQERHPDEQDRPAQEAEEQLAMDAGRDPGHRVDDRPEPPRVARKARLSELGRLVGVSRHCRLS